MLIHSFMDGHLGCFQLSAIVNNAAKEHRCTNMCLNPIFNSLGCTPKVAWADHVVNVFFIFEEPPYCIHSCCPILHSYSQSEGFTSSIWGRGKHSPEKHMTCSRVPECLQNQGSIQSFLALWMLALNQNVKLGLWSIRGGSPPHNWWSLGQPSPAELCRQETFHVPK